MWKRFFVILLFLIIANNAHAMIVNVSITNGTTGEEVADYSFLIKVLERKDDGTVITLKSFQLKTVSSGNFRGTVDRPSGDAISAEVNYRGVSYETPPIDLKKEQSEYSFDVSVYDITDNSKHVMTKQRTMMASAHDAGTVQVFDILTVENSSNQTYVGKFNDSLDTHQILFVPLPQGYRLTHVQGIDPRKVITFNKGIITQDAIAPGRKEILIGYVVRSDTGLFDFSLFSEKDAPRIEKLSFLFRKDSEWKVRPSYLKPAGDSEVWGKTYSSWKAGEMKSVVRIKLYGPSYKGIFNSWTLVLLFGILIPGIVLYFGRHKFRHLNLTMEEKKLKNVLMQLEDEADQEDLREYYLPFRESLERRLEHIKQRMTYESP